jgi:monoamine oxidase
MKIDRRTFLAASAAATLAAPALRTTSAEAQALVSGEVDVVIVGAGAAGIAAARRVIAAGRKFALIEASDHVGGRCITDTKTFGVPFDRGAHWVHMPDLNPVVKQAAAVGVDIYSAPPGQKVRIGRRYAREGEMEDYLATQVRAHRAIDEAARKGDISCAQALPRDLGDWQKTIEFALGPYSCGKDLNEVSALDFSRSLERDIDAFCRIGYGAMLAKLAEKIPVQLNAPATRISWGMRTGVDVETPRGTVSGRTAVITVSTNILGSGKIKFTPDLPRRQLDAAAKLSLGSYDHIMLELPGNPLGLQRDDLVVEKADSNKTAGLLANVSGSTLCMVDVAGRFGRELSAQGDKAMVTFALEWLGNLYGTDLKKSVQRTAATRWNEDPWTMGAFSAAAPGSQSARRAMIEALNGRVWFAGEAAHETLWGTVGGAWDSGERAATEALKSIGALKPPPEEKPAPQQQRNRRRS